jgi:hypothetical protein
MSGASGSKKQDDLEKLKLFRERQDAEATLHWSRNSYFLVIMSILFVAYGQKPAEGSQLASFQVLIAILGAILSVIWLLIQDRSSQYTLYYKQKARKYAELTNTTDLYPRNLGRSIEMRKLAYFLPLSFLAIWVVFIILRVPFVLPSS